MKPNTVKRERNSAWKWSPGSLAGHYGAHALEITAARWNNLWLVVKRRWRGWERHNKMIRVCAPPVCVLPSEWVFHGYKDATWLDTKLYYLDIHRYCKSNQLTWLSPDTSNIMPTYSYVFMFMTTAKPCFATLHVFSYIHYSFLSKQ